MDEQPDKQQPEWWPKPPSDAELSDPVPEAEAATCPVCRVRIIDQGTNTCAYSVCVRLHVLREAIQAGKRSEFATGPHSPLRELIGEDGDGGNMTISRPKRIDGLDGMAA